MVDVPIQTVAELSEGVIPMPEEIHLSIYCDESTDIRLESSDSAQDVSKWDYMALLLVPSVTQKRLLQKLLDARCLNPKNSTWLGCSERCKWHEHNNVEVHYNRLDSTHNYKIADSWLRMLIRQNMDDEGLVFFYILGLDRSKLDLDRFGPRSDPNRDITLYNRFFRTAIQKSAKSFFHDYDHIVIDSIYHDKGEQGHHPLFPWHSIWRLGREDDKLAFGTDSIAFIDSDHREAGGDAIHSHFIQFIDLLLGCTVNILHYQSRSKNKLAASLTAKPLLGDRIIGNPSNVNSRYHYVGRQKIEFFPRVSLAGYDQNSLLYQMTQMNNFYTKRELRIERHQQPTLFDGLGSSS